MPSAKINIEGQKILSKKHTSAKMQLDINR